MGFMYPSELIDEFKINWKKPIYHESKAPSLPSDDILIQLFNVSYHASFLAEEQRGLAFSIIFCESGDLNTDYKPVNIIELDKERDFSIGELMRLSPATDYRRVLIGVKKKKGNFKETKLVIWGLVEIGSEWYDFVHGENSGAMIPPDYLTIYSNKPGFLNISRQGHSILRLSAGQSSSPITDVFWRGPISNFFESGGSQFYTEVLKDIKADTYDPEGHDDDYPKRKYKYFIQRLLFNIKQLNHGGVVLIVPDSLNSNDSRITDRLSIKYPICYQAGWDLSKKSVATQKKYFDLYFPLIDGKEILTKENFSKVSRLHSDMDKVEKKLSDSIKFIASLSGVDGAVLITDKLRVLGFGCEVIAQSSSLEFVKVSSKGVITGQKKVPIESYGTRHRSTFRFCSSFEEAVGFIVSQDGGIKCTKRVGKDLILWPNIDSEM